MSLKEKAKTLEQWLYGNQCTSLNKIMVRLEDAQQLEKERDVWKSDFKKLEAMFKRHVDGVKKEKEELKQKLEQMLKKARAERMEHALDYPDAPASPLWERNQGKIEILEELLKEEKTKP